jgi:uncharacterized protein YjiK
MASPTQQKSPSRSRFVLRWYVWLLLVIAAAYGLAFAMHWDDRGVLWVLERFESKAEQKESVWLPDYQVVIDAKPLPGMEKDEASDLAYNPQTRTLFAVMGKNAFLVELTLQGDVLRKMPLVGWSNPEGLTVMENGLLAIVDEREHTLSIVKVDAATRELNIADFPKYDLGPSKDQNKAFEAITWDGRCSPGKAMAARPCRATSRNWPAISWICATCRRWLSIRALAICWCCPPIRTCCWNWTKPASKSAS